MLYCEDSGGPDSRFHMGTSEVAGVTANNASVVVVTIMGAGSTWLLFSF